MMACGVRVSVLYTDTSTAAVDVQASTTNVYSYTLYSRSGIFIIIISNSNTEFTRNESFNLNDRERTTH